MGQSPVDLLEPPLPWPVDEAAGLIGNGRYADSKCKPHSVEELADQVKAAAADGLAIYPQGGRTALDYGGVPARPGRIVDTTALDRVIDYPAADMTITVEAGMTLAGLQAILSKENQYLPIDPPQGDRATLGGMIATGWTGPRRHLAMRPRDQVIGIGFVNGTGTLVKGGGRVVKNVAGYDFPKLLSGSPGSLGVIPELTFKLRPRPESTAIAWVGCPNLAATAALLETLNHSATRPSAIELLNRSGQDRLGLAAFGFEPAEFAVAIGFDDSAKTVAWQCEAIRTELPAGATLEIRRDAESLPVWAALTELRAVAGTTLQARVVTRPGALAALLEHVNQARWAVQAHGGQGIATLSLINDLQQDEVARQLAGWEAQVGPLGGAVTLPVCPAEWKSQMPVWGLSRPDWSLMAGIKTALDRHRILNPGRFLGLS